MLYQQFAANCAEIMFTVELRKIAECYAFWGDVGRLQFRNSKCYVDGIGTGELEVDRI